MNSKTYIHYPSDLILPDGTINPRWIVKVGGHPGNPAGGTYWTVEYILARDLTWRTLFGPEHPTPEDIANFSVSLMNDAIGTIAYTAESLDAAKMFVAQVSQQYSVWAAQQNAPAKQAGQIGPVDSRPFGGKPSGTILG
jgi:hypothetical protein